MKSKILLFFFISSLFMMLTNSCSNRKIIGEYIGFHKKKRPALKEAPPSNTEKEVPIIDSNGVITTTKQKTEKHIIITQVFINEKVTHTIFIDRKLNVTIQFQIEESDMPFANKVINYTGKGEIKEDSIIVTINKKEESFLGDVYSTHLYKQPFVVTYLITEDSNEIDCLLYHPGPDSQLKGIDYEIWTYTYWFYTPKQIKKKAKKG